MFKTFFGHEPHHGRRPDAIIRTKSGIVGRDTFTIHDHTDRVGVEIVGRSAIGLGHHIDMGLKDDHLAILEPRFGRNGNDKVAAAVAEMGETLGIGHLFQKL